MQLEKGQELKIYDDKQLRLECRNKPEVLNMNDIYRNDAGSDCGYCHKGDGSVSWSFTKKKIQPYTYELMMERGWRRCGTYYYKPNLIKSCCKLFTHRLEVQKFKIKKDQKKALKKVIAIAYQLVQKIQNQQKEKQDKKFIHKQEKIAEKSIDKNEKKKPQISLQMINRLKSVCNELTIFLRKQIGVILNEKVTSKAISQFNFDFEDKIKFFKSKPGQKSNYYSNYVMLIFGINKKLFIQNKYSLLDFSKDIKKSIEGYKSKENIGLQVQRGGYLLFKIEGQQTHEFQILEELSQKIDIQAPKNNNKQNGIVMSLIETIRNKIKGEEKIEKQKDYKNDLSHKKSNHFEVLKPHNEYKGEINITYNKITFGKITVDIVPAEQSQESFRLYSKYCAKIHEKKQKSMSSYINFLCLQAINFKQLKTFCQQDKAYIPSWDPTEKHQKAKNNIGEVKKLLGCYHMKYYFENKLIGVGVVDIVNHGLSSVYYFYDPEFKQARLGVFSSLIQIEYVRWLNLSFPQFRYYYMGFYIANSQKMNYKVDYSPCQLLCPITYNFVGFTEQIKNKTDKIAKGQEKDIRLSLLSDGINEDMKFGKDIGPYIDKNINIMYENKKLVLKEINPHFYIHILKIINTNLPVWGKKLFQIFTLTL